jgi:hypothetical protein
MSCTGAGKRRRRRTAHAQFQKILAARTGEAPAIRSLSSPPPTSRAPVPWARNPDYEEDLPISCSGMETSSENSRDNRCPFANLRPNVSMKLS